MTHPEVDLAHQVFFELHTDLPREGPGSLDSTRRALAVLGPLPEKPQILDLGCGPGMQTLHLAQLTDGAITAVDNHAPYLAQLAARAVEAGVRDRITLLEADMGDLPLPPQSFDILWSEGAAYTLGWRQALTTWRPLLRPSGYAAISEVSWLQPNPPEAVRQFWAAEYPPMTTIENNLAIAREAGYQILGHFVLPAADWWDHYYTPLAQQLETLQVKYANVPDALAVLDLHRQEMAMHRQYADHYGYVFYCLQAT